MQRRDGLEAKFRLLALLPYERRAKRKHMLVFGFILDWYHSKYGDALASVRHVVDTLKERDPAGRGLYTGDVHSALTDLVAWGYLEQEKGKGRMASRYIPAWSKLDCVRENENATDTECSVREFPNTSVREIQNTTPDSVSISPNKDPSTPTRAPDPETGRDGHDCSPPAHGLAASAAEQDGFEQLYTAYGVRKDKADARRVYEQIAPSAELHDRMMAAAAVWRKAAGGIERMRLRRWLEEERYDEDPKGERKSRPEPQPKASNDNRVPARPWGVLEVVDTNVIGEAGMMHLVVYFDNDTSHTIWLEHSDQKLQDRGQRELGSLCRAADIMTIEDSSDLHFAVVKITTKNDGELTFAPAARCAA